MEGPTEQRSLKSKWKEHWDTRDQIFKVEPQKANKLGVIFYWCFTLSMLYTALVILIPHVTDGGGRKQRKSTWLNLFALFCFFEMSVNWFLCARRTISKVEPENFPKNAENNDSELTKHGWRSCPLCQISAPPRSYHCKVCGFCVLKRDHHCFFTGSCIGFFNQRYFIVHVFHSSVAGIYSLVLLLTYLINTFPLNTLKGFNIFLPCAIYGCFNGSVLKMDVFLIIQLYASITLTVASLFFCFWQVLMVYRGQTTYEATRELHVFRMDPSSHFRSVFGPFWIINFILPLPTKQEGDGITWQMYKNLKGH